MSCNRILSDTNLKATGYTAHQNDYLCKKNATTSYTTCYCAKDKCNDDITLPKSTSGAASTAGGVLAMVGMIILARMMV